MEKTKPSWLIPFTAGIMLFTLGLTGLFSRFNYLFTFWPFILACEGLSLRLFKDSFLFGHPRAALPTLIFSVSYWFFFELLNVRLSDFYYIDAIRVDSLFLLITGGLYLTVSFASVLTGILSLAFFLEKCLPGKNTPRRHTAWPRLTTYVLQLTGVILFCLALAYPDPFSVLIWGQIFLMLEPLNYRYGRFSLLRKIEEGAIRPVLCLLAAGLLCGIAWEGFNVLSPTRWIYTVSLRGLPRLFEMPLPGYLGYLGLALDIAAVLSFGQFLFFTATENGTFAGFLSRPRKSFTLSVPLHIAFWLLALYFVDSHPIASFRLELGDLKLAETEMTRLGEMNVHTGEDLYALASDPDGRSRLRFTLGWTGETTDRFRERFLLYSKKGVGAFYGSILEQAGIMTPEQLALQDPGVLAERLAKTAEYSGLMPPSRKLVKYWVEENR